MKFPRSLIFTCALSSIGVSAFSMQGQPLDSDLALSGDVESLFVRSSSDLNLAALSAKEMRETEGAVAPWIIGGIGGVY